jgi:hypothetical protein
VEDERNVKKGDGEMTKNSEENTVQDKGRQT